MTAVFLGPAVTFRYRDCLLQLLTGLIQPRREAVSLQLLERDVASTVITREKVQGLELVVRVAETERGTVCARQDFRTHAVAAHFRARQQRRRLGALHQGAAVAA